MSWKSLIQKMREEDADERVALRTEVERLRDSAHNYSLLDDALCTAFGDTICADCETDEETVAAIKAHIEKQDAEVERLRRGQEAWDAVEKYGIIVQRVFGAWGTAQIGNVISVIKYPNPIDAVLALRDQIEGKEGGA